MEDLLLRFAINAIVVTILTLGIYFKMNKKTEFLFNIVLFNILIFFVSSLLIQSELNTGFAFGIFAVFSLLRFRTEPVPIKEMTYMFIAIVIAIINSTVTSGLTVNIIILANVGILLASIFMEVVWMKNHKEYKKIIFEDIKLIHTEKKLELIEVLESRTGYTITEVEIEKIDYLKDVAILKVYIG